MIPHAFEKKDDQDSIVSFDYEKTAKHVKWYDKILLNRPLKVILALLLTSVLAPILVYLFIFFPSEEQQPLDGFSFGSCLVSRNERIPCGIADVPQEKCHQQCCYDLENLVCYHRVPSRFTYLIRTEQNWTEEMIMTPRLLTVPYNEVPSIPAIQLSMDEVSSSHLSLNFYDPRLMSLTGLRIEEKSYEYHISSPELAVVVDDVNTNATIFSTNRGPIIAADDIWEIAFKLTDYSMYGLGEIPLKPGTVKVIYSHDGGVSSIPLIFARTNGSYHGLLIDVKTPTEITVGEANQIVLRTITKTGIKLHLFTGLEPKDIMKDVLRMVGSPKPVDYWMLGPHVCTEVSASDEEALTQLNTFIQEASTAKVPFESHCGIKPIVFEAEALNSTQTAPVISGAAALVNARKLFVPHVSPYIRYEPPEIIPVNETIAANETVSNQTTVSNDTECDNFVCEFSHMMLQLSSQTELQEVYLGTAGERSVVYPDYRSENVTELLDILWPYEMELDGVVLQNNWPLDDSVKSYNETTELPYFNEHFESAFNNTPQWNARTPDGDYYLYDHNEYGSNFLDTFRKKFNHTQIYSTSQWMRTDAVVNRQNVPSTWLSLRQELVQAALGGISGHWLWSSPICGDTATIDLETQTALCIKWYMAGTYFPLTKIHSKSIRRDPLVFEGTNRILIIEALTRRISLLPYFYTVLQNGPLLRPMFYQFPFSEELVDLSNQFSVGDALLIVPNLQPLQTHVHFWMPPGSWYEFWGGLRIKAAEGSVVTMTTTDADFITLIHGGNIIPMQKVIQDTAALTRLNSDFTLIVATERVNTTTNNQIVETDIATGDLRMTSNMTIHFEVTGNQLLITSSGDDFSSFCGTEAVWNSIIRDIDMYGLSSELNNYDNHRNINITAGINLCDLETNSNIVFTLY